MHDTILTVPMTAAHWEQVRQIYLEGIASRMATFETEAPSWKTWDAGHLDSCRYAACQGRRILGWAALSAVSSRWVYRGVAEVSVYVRSDCAGQGVGSILMQALIAGSEAAGFWTLQSVVFPENEASLRLHANHGFRVVGRRQRIAQLQGRWHDTILMERRSSVVGCIAESPVAET